MMEPWLGQGIASIICPGDGSDWQPVSQSNLVVVSLHGNFFVPLSFSNFRRIKTKRDKTLPNPEKTLGPAFPTWLAGSNIHKEISNRQNKGGEERKTSISSTAADFHHKHRSTNRTISYHILPYLTHILPISYHTLTVARYMKSLPQMT